MAPDNDRPGGIVRPVGKRQHSSRTTAERRASIHRRRFDPGNALDTGEKALDDRGSLGHGVSRRRRPDPERHHAIAVEPLTESLHSRDVVQQKARSSKEQHRQRDFDDDERFEHTARNATPSLVFLQRVGHSRA